MENVVIKRQEIFHLPFSIFHFSLPTKSNGAPGNLGFRNDQMKDDE